MSSNAPHDPTRFPLPPRVRATLMRIRAMMPHLQHLPGVRK